MRSFTGSESLIECECEHAPRSRHHRYGSITIEIQIAIIQRFKDSDPLIDRAELLLNWQWARAREPLLPIAPLE